MSDEKITPVEEKKPFVKKGVDRQAFVERKLKAINTMADQTKAKVLAERVLRNK